MPKELTIVLVSGGMDSCVVTSIADTEYELAMLHVNYGQLTEKRELKAFNDIADHYKVGENRRLTADISYLSKIGGSSLTDKKIEIDNPAQDNSVVPNTYVPFRNTHFLSIAVSWAEVICARTIFIGAVAQDRPAYPDCNQPYYDVFNELITVGTKPATQIKIVTPIIEMQKSEIVEKGVSLNAPLGLTWSCYKNNEAACGKCNSCILRLEAFDKAGIKDAVRYSATL
ncbi:MAG: 7-cyano-7-deazaguanine synthase QueC [Candidatus Anammoxibacter sp.]